MKRKIRLTESYLHKIVKETVKRILKEDFYDLHKDLMDNAFKNSKDVNDFNKNLESVKFYDKLRGKHALELHPQTTPKDINNDSYIYLHPDLYGLDSDDLVDKKLSSSANYRRSLLGLDK